MPDFLLELLSEEIPARMQGKAQQDLARLFSEQLSSAGLAAEAVATYATPRRLVLIARGLPAETAAVREETKGPRSSAPPQALEGFLRKTGLTRDQLEERDGVLFATVEKPGRAASAVLAEAIPAIVRAFPWPRSMRWGAASASTESPRWVRPLQGIVALFGEEIVDFEIAGVRSGAATLGHRFHHPGPITLGGAHDYVEKLQACHVLVDPAERRRIVAEGAKAAAQAAGLTLVWDEGLLAENAGLTEWPVPLLGRFDPAFLEVPREVIQLTMRTNQKYFACTDGEGELAPNFVCTANIEAKDGGASIVAGNERVLSARLSDAKFFWEQDLKVPLEEQAGKLGDIVFHEKLGTVADKVERVAKLARWLVEEGIVGTLSPAGRGQGEGAQSPQKSSNSEPPHPNPLPPGEREKLADLATRAARLCKADLVTGLVGEFPELQGLIGGHLARAQGEHPAVADAIRDHYKPVGQGDEVPTAPVTVAVSLADKLDSLFAFIGRRELPTGSRDPYALRRQAIAIIQLVTSNGVRLPIAQACGALAVFHEERYAWRMADDIPNLDVRLKDHFAQKQQNDRYEFEELQNLIWTATEEFLASVPELPEVPGDAYVRNEQERRIGAMHRTFIPWNLWFECWDEVAASAEMVISFFADRLKVQQREAGVRHDLIDAVFALGGEDDLVRLLARVKALQAFVETPEGADLLAGYKRAANILKKEDWPSPSPQGGKGRLAEGERGEGARPPREPASAEHPHPALSLEGEGHKENKSLPYTPEIEETALIAALDSAEPRARSAVEAEDFEGAMAVLASLRAPVDSFFDKVTVNDPDPVRREARLALLARMRDAVHRVADFSRIEG
ncbi:MAG TPA: glycine--tRNA ligase subunit beta [Allosphingosinicella sp.]|nr:glycine--tRNA ligase subunit beta [Allosphingosinicella sp.]